MLKKILISILGLILVSALTAAWFFGPYYFKAQHFKANASNGYYADFYLYVSSGAQNIAESGGAATLLVQPNNSGTNSDDASVHQKDAWMMGFERHKIAEELNVVLLVPAFVRPAIDWEIYTHALDRDALTTQREDLARIDLQLIAMIEEARSSLKAKGIQSNQKVLLQGFSASGMFANRFTLLHPEHVLAVAVGSPGGWPVAPVSTFKNRLLSYPAGIADIEILTGKPFDLAAFAAVPQIIIMGGDDDNDSLDFTDGWDKDAATQVDSLFGSDPLSRWPHAEGLYKQAGVNAKFILVDGIGHDRKKLQSYGVDFFKEILSHQ
ncbi:hypothetical protein JKA74_13515 [Marivirga sp. S37H4]|uniref:Uncharacterized protein n=1 Tax=Marivirga aurantiaca TaxID=2802615 RepID=A0A934X0D6_9BACT|nr:hypothetical protein [Marivirga aurantiaca]MBK6266056.1 hypothetical protein [Marivirga aurantiaca]